jgi:ribosomal protein S18 acetylase RimI-like enzyme
MGPVAALFAKKLRTGWHLATRDPAGLRKLLRFEPYVVFSARATDIPSRAAPEGITVRRLTRAEVEALLPLDEDVRDGMRRCGALADEAVFAAFYHGAFAHLSWFITGERDRERMPPRLVRLRQYEAEITHCVTLPEFRGRQIYAYVISFLFDVARSRGIREIFMVTRHDNVASQRGILRAGLTRRRGRIYLLRILYMFPACRTFRLWR